MLGGELITAPLVPEVLHTPTPMAVAWTGAAVGLSDAGPARCAEDA